VYLTIKFRINFTIAMKKTLASIVIVLLSIFAFAQTVYITPSGNKYHTINCRMVKNVSSAVSVEDAQNKGRTACKICAPPLGNSFGSGIKKRVAGSSSLTYQCKGRTKTGNRCRHRTHMANGFCFQHVR
jgi:hypothetical protein